MTDRESEIEELRIRHGLVEEEAVVLLHILDLYRDIVDQVQIQLAREGSGGGDVAAVATAISSQWDWDSASDPPPELPRAAVVALLECLDEPNVARALHAEIYAMAEFPVAAYALGVFADWATEITSSTVKPALLWLRATAQVLIGAVAEAEADLQAAESLDPDWPLVLEGLARFASDRGDRDGGLELLRRAHTDLDDPLLMLLKRFEPSPRSDLSRNDPCWCGSGRHYKRCHMRREQLPLGDRADWLYQKALAALQDYPWHNVKVIESAIARGGREMVEYLLNEDVIVYDVVLCEGGAFNDFLRYRGFLLPEDELRLAEQWQHVKRSVHEVISVRRGESVTIRDVRTGEVTDVRERAGSMQMKVGSFYCARPCPAGDTVQFFGGVQPVSPSQLRRLVDVLNSNPGPIEVIEALARRSA